MALSNGCLPLEANGEAILASSLAGPPLFSGSPKLIDSSSMALNGSQPGCRPSDPVMAQLGQVQSCGWGLPRPELMSQRALAPALEGLPTAAVSPSIPQWRPLMSPRTGAMES
jgi:hypothetical protein